MVAKSILKYCVIWLTINLVLVQGTAKHDAEVRLKADLFKNYSKEVLPPHGNNPIVIQVGLSIITISNVDPKSQEMYTNAWIKMDWKDSRLKWDEVLYSGLNVIRIQSRHVWQPDIYLYNGAYSHEQGPISSKVLMLLYPDGHVMWIPPMTLYSHCEFDLKFYPYDTHECIFKFGSWTHHADDIRFAVHGNQSQVDLSDMWNTGGEWEIIDSRATSNLKKYDCCEESYSDVTFYITLRRRSPFYRATILCPVIAVVLLILISFWISPVAYEKMALNIVAFLTLVLLLLHFSSKLPAIGNDAPMIVNTCAALLFLAAIVTGQSIFFHGFLTFQGHRGVPRWVNVLLSSCVTKLFCISPQVSFESLNSAEDPSNLVGTEGDSKMHRESSLTPQQNQWILFVRLVDRFLFIVFVIVIFSLLIAAAS